MSFSAAPTESFDVIVVGGGHAGCEAEITAAWLGLNTALFSLNLDRIAWQPYNPAVGGSTASMGFILPATSLGAVSRTFMSCLMRRSTEPTTEHPEALQDATA